MRFSGRVRLFRKGWTFSGFRFWLLSARRRLSRHGHNELKERPRPGFMALLWDQFNNFLIIILIVAALVSLALGEYVDSIAIILIVIFNAVIGVVQESKAEQALEALQKMSAPNVAVIRDGALVSISPLPTG